MRVLMIEPQKNPYPKEIGGDIGAIMQAVGGVFDTVYFDPDDHAIIFCNDCAARLPPNRIVGDQILYGTFLIAGQTMTADGAAACSLTEAQIMQFTEMFAVSGVTAQIRGIFGLSEDAPTMGGMT